MRNSIGFITFTLALMLVAPAIVGAQECTVRCECYSSGCGCLTQGGNGCKCNTGGGGCFVCACGQLCCDPTDDETSETAVVGIAADGSPVSREVPRRQLGAQREVAGTPGSSAGPYAEGNAPIALARLTSFRAPTTFRISQQATFGWEWMNAGYAVRRDCSGIVIKRAFSGPVLQRILRETQAISL